jgi:hypothetical protein
LPLLLAIVHQHSTNTAPTGWKMPMQAPAMTPLAVRGRISCTHCIE